MSENPVETVNANEFTMDMWFKESMEALSTVFESAEKIIEKEKNKND